MVYIVAVILIALTTIQKAVGLVHKKNTIFNSLFVVSGLFTIILFILNEYVLEEVLAIYIIMLVFTLCYGICVLIDFLKFIKELFHKAKKKGL